MIGRIDKDLLYSSAALSVGIMLLLVLIASPILVPILLIIIGFAQFFSTLLALVALWAIMSFGLYSMARAIK